MASSAPPSSTALRRIRADVMELSKNPSPLYKAAPLEDDFFEWHFTVRGPTATEFAGGLYHGRILLPPEYPFKPPSILMLTPSGRFEVNTKICLSLTAHHPEHWQPAWGVRTILEALVAFFPTPADSSIGALHWRPDERRVLARRSRDWVCPQCGPIAKLVTPEDLPESPRRVEAAAEDDGGAGQGQEEETTTTTEEATTTVEEATTTTTTTTPVETTTETPAAEETPAVVEAEASPDADEQLSAEQRALIAKTKANIRFYDRLLVVLLILLALDVYKIFYFPGDNWFVQFREWQESRQRLYSSSS